MIRILTKPDKSTDPTFIKNSKSHNKGKLEIINTQQVQNNKCKQYMINNKVLKFD